MKKWLRYEVYTANNSTPIWSSLSSFNLSVPSLENGVAVSRRQLSQHHRQKSKIDTLWSVDCVFCEILWLPWLFVSRDVQVSWWIYIRVRNMGATCSVEMRSGHRTRTNVGNSVRIYIFCFVGREHSHVIITTGTPGIINLRWNRI